MEVISRKEAKKQGLTKYFTGNPCKYGHIAERFVSTSHCLVCVKTIQVKCKKAYKKNNRTELLRKQREYDLRVKEKRKPYFMNRYQQKKDNFFAHARNY